MSRSPAQTTLVLLRHGPTDWNAAGRIQGRSDPPLSAAGREAVAAWRLPADLAAYDWVTSPLARAVETAALLGHPEAAREPALREMDWGAWEGESLAALRRADPEGMARNEARGLDFRPAGGESPRELQARLAPWLDRLGGAGRASVAVCHKGVIRALYALASGWDMTGPPPEKLRDGCWHSLAVAAGGGLSVAALNRSLAP